MQKTVTLKEFQKDLLDIFAEFHNYCVENKLTYYMIGGTLLGAVRENGFIPWDDDIDVAMPRPDYERFVNNYSGAFCLHSLKNNKKHMFPYVKLFHGTTPVVRVEDEDFNFHASVFSKIDIYPIDGLSNNDYKAIKHFNKVNRAKHLLFLNLSKAKSKSSLKNAILRLISLIPARLILKNIDKKMRKYSYETSEYLTRWREGGKEPNIVKKEVFGNPKAFAFEEYVFWGPEHSEEYLTSVYGDYMTRVQVNGGPRHNSNENAITEKLESDLTQKHV